MSMTLGGESRARAEAVPATRIGVMKRILIIGVFLVLACVASVGYLHQRLFHSFGGSNHLFPDLAQRKISGNNNNGDKRIDQMDNRPWMIVHVGPPKTGTTTIQNGLEKVASRLAEDDNVYFVGSVLYEIKRKGGTKGRPNVTMFRMRDFVPPSEPIDEFLRVLRIHQKNGHNVVVSSEHLTERFENHPQHWQRIFQNLFLLSQNSSVSTIENDSQEPFLGFRVKVVITYRHFFEWLPSFWIQQYELLDRINPPRLLNVTISRDSSILHPYRGYVPGITEYVEWFIHDSTQYTDANINHTAYAKRFPGKKAIINKKKQVLPTSHAPVWSFHQWSSRPEFYDRVHVFDMHQQLHPFQDGTNTAFQTHKGRRNFFADFICQMLPAASNTCRYLDEETGDGNFTRRVNRGKEKNLLRTEMYRILQTAKRLGRNINTPRLKQLIRKEKKLHNTTKHLKRCLSKKSTEKLKMLSWKFLLQQILLVQKQNSKRRSSPASSALFKSSRPTEHLLLSSQRDMKLQMDLTRVDFGASALAFTKAKHDESFEQFVATEAFCEIDMEILFKNEDFINKVLI